MDFTRDSFNLHVGDKVTVRQTGLVAKIIEIKFIMHETARKTIVIADLKLDDGHWYDHSTVDKAS